MVGCRIDVLVGIRDRRLRTRATEDLDRLGHSVSIADTEQRVTYAIHMAGDGSDAAVLGKVEALCGTADGPLKLAVVSDALVTVDGDDIEPNDLARGVRRYFWKEDDLDVRDSNRVVSLVAIAKTGRFRVGDVDRIVNRAGIDAETMNDAIRAAARALWLKSPLPPERSTSPLVIVRAVQSLEELKWCMRLRHDMYEALGYLDPETIEESRGLDLDAYDLKSLHFIALAVDDEESDSTRYAREAPCFPRADRGRARLSLAGSMRMISPSYPATRISATLVGDLTKTIDHQRRWVDEIARTVPALRDRLGYRTDALPLCATVENWEVFGKIAKAEEKSVEISRLVAHPDYLRQGVSTLLMRAGLATAMSAGRLQVLLECVPTHARMYQKQGFELYPQVRGRAPGLEQYAVGMRCGFARSDDSDSAEIADPMNAAATRALNAKEKVRERGPRQGFYRRGFLCRCENKDCWRTGRYEGERNPGCPLPDSWVSARR